MNKIITCLFIASIAFSSCENFKDEFESVSRERDSLIFVGDMKDSSINTFLGAFNEIETNLDTIARRQTDIDINATQSAEIKGDQRERINENIRIINDLLERNRKLLADAQRELRVSQGRVHELNAMIAKLQEQVAARESELAALKIQLADLNLNLENLNVMLDTITAQKSVQELELKDKIERLQTAYFVVGTFKELRDKNVVNKEGGFLGIGKNQMLKQDFNNDAFTKLNVTQTVSITLDCKSAKVITNHPSNSYELVKEGDKVKSLNILDYEKFWGASKYLVVVKG